MPDSAKGPRWSARCKRGLSWSWRDEPGADGSSPLALRSMSSIPGVTKTLENVPSDDTSSLASSCEFIAEPWPWRLLVYNISKRARAAAPRRARTAAIGSLLVGTLARRPGPPLAA